VKLCRSKFKNLRISFSLSRNDKVIYYCGFLFIKYYDTKSMAELIKCEKTSGAKAKMLVMFHHSHNIFARMFSTINSKEIAFDIKVPLLVVNEKANIYPPVSL
jgi:hypothetical protein